MTLSYFGTALSVALYILLFFSIFDIYYTSPLVHGVSYDRPSTPSLVKTIVFIVADGLRVDKLFTERMEHTTTLKELVAKRGSWGLSHTRVPTESRPGHVAIFAGFYEDVASVTRGWQTNAVEFDSIFNRTHQAYLWGGPDVVPMFQLPDGRVNISSYSHAMLDFTAENITQIDDWVVDRFTEFMAKNSSYLHEADQRSSLIDEYRRGSIVFLHLSAADQVGHTQKPNSEEYTKMIKNVDRNVARILKLFEDKPQLLEETAFIFTADHGMTDWGSHGAGSLHETATPLITWGKNIPSPVKMSGADQKSEFPGLLPFTYGLKYHTIRQADLCPFMAALLGIPIPANSVGELPLDLLDVDSSTKVNLIRANANQILKQLQIKYEEQRASHYQVFFREFIKLTQFDVSDLLSTAATQTINKDFENAIETYRKLIRLGLEGLSYYHKYDRFFMGLCIMTSYAMWSVMLCSEIFPAQTEPLKIQSNGNKASGEVRSLMWSGSLVLIAIACILTVISAHQRSLLRTFYQLLPLLLASMVLLTPRFRRVLLQAYGLFSGEDYSNRDNTRHWTSLKMFLLLVALMECTLCGFFRRSLMSIGAIILGFWPVFDASFITLPGRSRLRRIWLAACLALAVFPSLPIVGSFSSPTLVFTSSLCIAAASLVFLVECRGPSPAKAYFREPHYFLALCAIISGFLVLLVRHSVAESEPIPVAVHFLSWALLVFSPILAIFGSGSVVSEKLVSLALAFFIPFNLMNVFYEGFFYIVLMAVTFLWAWLESGLEFHDFFQTRLTLEPIVKSNGNPPSTPVRNLTPERLRRPFFYVFFVIYSFFGTGNIASVNTFDPVAVYSFMTVLDPAVMGTLLIFKMIFPVVIVGAVYACVARVKETLPGAGGGCLAEHHRLFTTPTELPLLMVIANFMAVHFFAMLRDEGSWMDIGESISHYVIAMSIGLASVLLSLLGRLMLLSGINPNSVPSHHHREVLKVK